MSKRSKIIAISAAALLCAVCLVFCIRALVGTKRGEPHGTPITYNPYLVKAVETYTVDGNVVTTSYYSFTLPEGMEDKYAIAYTDGYADDEGGAFPEEKEDYPTIHPIDHVISVYEKSGYENHTGGRLFDIHVSDSEPILDYSTDIMYGMLASENKSVQHYFYVTFPLAKQTTEETKTAYEELKALNESVLSSIMTADGYSIVPFEENNGEHYKSEYIYLDAITEDGMMIVILSDGNSTMITLPEGNPGGFEVGQAYTMNYYGTIDPYFYMQDIDIVNMQVRPLETETEPEGTELN